MTDLKYDDDSKENILQTCTSLVKHPSIPFRVCPFLENPLSAAKCYMTQSVQEDKQKSKSVSDVFNALEGLGFIERVEKGGKLTDKGIGFASEPYESKNTLTRLKNALVGYGPFIGLLHEISKKDGTISKSSVKLGYPVTNERVKYEGRYITLSTGSQQDTITRTRSVLFIWATTAGFVIPEGIDEPKNSDKWHVEVLDYIRLKKWNENTFRILLPRDFFKEKITIKQPLYYNAMTKSTKALRERNQEAERLMTLKLEPIINNRRFAIVYCLAVKSNSNQNLDIKKLVKALQKYPEIFVINKSEFDEVLEKELDIAKISGMPFERDGNILVPLTKVDLNTLTRGVPEPLIKTLSSITKEI